MIHLGRYLARKECAGVQEKQVPIEDDVHDRIENEKTKKKAKKLQKKKKRRPILEWSDWPGRANEVVRDGRRVIKKL